MSHPWGSFRCPPRASGSTRVAGGGRFGRAWWNQQRFVSTPWIVDTNARLGRIGVHGSIVDRHDARPVDRSELAAERAPVPSPLAHALALPDPPRWIGSVARGRLDPIRPM